MIFAIIIIAINSLHALSLSLSLSRARALSLLFKTLSSSPGGRVSGMRVGIGVDGDGELGRLE